MSLVSVNKSLLLQIILLKKFILIDLTVQTFWISVDSEKEIDNLIGKRKRVRHPNKQYVTAPVDTTDSETELKNSKKSTTVKASVLSARMESLKRKQENLCLPPPASLKKTKISDSNILDSFNNVKIKEERIEQEKSNKSKKVFTKKSSGKIQGSNSDKIVHKTKVDGSGKEMNIAVNVQETPPNKVVVRIFGLYYYTFSFNLKIQII